MRCQRHGTGKEGEELVNTGTEGNLALVSVMPLVARSTDSEVKLQHVPTKTH